MTKSEVIKILHTTKEKARDVYDWSKVVLNDILLKTEALMREIEIIDDVFLELESLKEDLEDMDDQETQEG